MEWEKALKIIAGQCSKRELCRSDVRRKLERWEVAGEETEKVMAFLVEHRFVDDRRFARIYAEDKFRFNHWGKQKIALMLRQKGIAATDIAEALEVIPAAGYTEGCMEVMRQKYGKLSEPNPYKLKEKLIRFGLGRGFDFDTVERCARQLLSGE